jgi:hypothetical protein
MSRPYKTDATGDVRLAYQERLKTYLKGEQPAPIYSEQMTTLQMPELDENSDTADEAAVEAEAADAVLARMHLILALAAQRDARYCVANRRYLFALGVNTHLRSDFEVFANAARAVGDLV